MIPIVTPEHMAAIDAAAPEPVEVLIDRAGRAVARAAVEMLGGTYGRTVTVIAGPGNNGADGRVAAGILRRRGVRVHVVEATSAPSSAPSCDLVIDAAFGTGFRGEWSAPTIAPSRHRSSATERPPLVLAVDIPSGIDAATGAAGPGVLQADRTITFQAMKPGHVFGRGRHLSGDVTVADIGLDVSTAERFLVEGPDIAEWLVRRPVDAHKWNGAVRVVAGSRGMLGAAELCASAAARAGAGLVALSTPGIDAHPRREVVQRPIDAHDFADPVLDDLHRFAALAIGPGLGRAEETVASVRRLVAEAAVPVVVDGDGLFAMAWCAEGAGALLRERGCSTVVTPHDGEYALLRGHPPGSDRVAAAGELADELVCTVLLKGPTTVVASPGEPTLVVVNGDERLATAGTGDVLTGIIAAELAAGLHPLHAAAAAAWLHGAAASCGPRRGLLAGDLIDHLPSVIADSMGEAP